MKLTNNAKAQLKPGMTLIELTVVIIVLLTLISVLFFAGTAYIKASNRTACLANQSTFQKAIRGYASLNQVEAGKALTKLDPLGAVVPQTWADVTAEGFIGDVTAMSCPTAKTPYATTGAITNPLQGAQVVECADGDYAPTGAGAATDAANGRHIPADIGNW